MEKEENKWVTLNRGEYLVNISNEIHKVCVGDGKSVTVNDAEYAINFRKVKDDVYVLNLFDSSFEITISDFYESKSVTASTKLSSKLQVNVNGSLMQAIVDDQRSLVAQSWLLRKPHISKSITLRAPMPGLITKVLVHQGMSVQMGGVLVVLEAMKMENEIRTLQKCKIESIFVQPGATVERNGELLRIIEI
ncbi:MAG: acetyl-CoA carboxylase biotin carboxyl carrier protein subunit [Bacteroidota bacterium]|jgi:biotin carboxyl carrier protein